MEGITLIGGDLSEEGKIRMIEYNRKYAERLAKFVQDSINTEIEKTADGFIKVTIPSLGVITWATDIEDCKKAISEVIESYKAQSEKYGE